MSARVPRCSLPRRAALPVPVSRTVQALCSGNNLQTKCMNDMRACKRAHTHTHTHTHARMHARAHTRMHARAHTHNIRRAGSRQTDDLHVGRQHALARANVDFLHR